MTPRPQVVVVGNGMAGLRFVQELIAIEPWSGITVIGAEPGGAYNRVQLPNVLAGTARADSIEIADEEWYAVRGVRLMAGVSARRIDRSGKVELSDGSLVPYDVLILATGSSALVPAARGLAGHAGLPAGAVAFRGLADCEQIRERAARARHAVVVGGGVLGMETACGLAANGVRVTVIQRGVRLMDRQLDAEAARVLARTARSLGVGVRTRTRVAEVRGAGRITGIELDDGRTLDADLLVLCCGTRPRTDLAKAAGLAIGAGVMVDDQMRSITDPAIFAIGDCAEHRGRVYGLVASAWAQARVPSLIAAPPPRVPTATAVHRP